MKRVIFDTNVYGYLIDEADSIKLEEYLTTKKLFLVYGYPRIRKELRNIPNVTSLSRKARNALLVLYDRIIQNRILPDSKSVIDLAKKYHAIYLSYGGIYSWKTSIKVDFMIVACATLNHLDIICSRDVKTLMSDKAISAYERVNEEEKLVTPKFIEYDKFINNLRNQFKG